MSEAELDKNPATSKFMTNAMPAVVNFFVINVIDGNYVIQKDKNWLLFDPWTFSALADRARNRDQRN